jgi:hypothetical protein
MKAHPAKAGVAKPRALAFPRGAGIQDATEDLKTAERSSARLGEEVGPAYQGREGDLLPRRAARHHRHAPGSGQRGSTRLR